MENKYWWWIGGGIVGAAGIGAGVYLLTRQQTQTTPTTTPTYPSLTTTSASTSPSTSPSASAVTHFTMSPALSASQLIATTSLTSVTLNGKTINVFAEGPGNTALQNYEANGGTTMVLAQLQSGFNSGTVNSYILAAGVQLGLIN